MTAERVTFAADGITLVGDLRIAPAPAPAVVLTGPFTGVKEQVVGAYAKVMNDRGVTTLAFDHRGFGESGGRPAFEDGQGKLADLRAAVSLLAAHPTVDSARVGAVGAGGVDGYRAALTAYIERWNDELPAVAPDGGTAAMSGDEPYAYYGTARSAAKTWENRVTYGSLHSLMTLDALGAAPLLSKTPLLVVHGRTDAYCSPERAETLYEQATGPKELLWLDAALHIDLYDVEPYVTQAADATADFLHRHLTH